MLLLSISIIIGILSIFIASFLFLNLRKVKISSLKMSEIASYISIGAQTYISRQIKTILLVAPFLAIILWFFLGHLVAITFIFGFLTSLTTIFLGMKAAVLANVKTAEDATKSSKKAFLTAVSGGSIMGFSITGFSILVLSILYFFFRNPDPLVGFGFGASLAALFAQIGGGIYTKSADIGADLVGKIERNIPEDDPRNPAVIADLVGDNVGDCAGRGSDLFESFSDDIITGMLVSLLFVTKYGPNVIFFPFILQSVGLVSSIIGIFSIRKLKNMKPEMSFNAGMTITTIIAILGSFFVAKYLLNDWSIFLAISLGILVTLVSSYVTKYYAGSSSKSVKDIANASKRGVALNIITGFSYGLRSPIIPIFMIVSAVGIAFIASGFSLLSIVAVNIGTDLLIGYIMTADAFGPITDNSAGIAKMSGESKKVVQSLSSLDSVGNTMKAITKAYAMSSGTVTAFVLFLTFFSIVGLKTLNVSTPFSVIFIFLGVSLPYLIASLVIGSTSKTALKMVDEVRRQFKTIKGLMSGKAKPDYAACIDVSTRNALREMFLPGLISIIVPIFVGVVFGVSALGSLLIGTVAGSALLSLFFNNTGTAFDNAKKLIEKNGSNGSFERQAAVAADTVGDPLKDVAGPSLLIFMKLMGMVALLVAIFIHYSVF